MTPDEHTDECMRGTTARLADIDAWKARHSGYCAGCLGGGYAGHAVEEAPAYCPACLEQGRCPRCGRSNPQWRWSEGAEETPCGSCGWNFGRGEDDACPLPYECACWAREPEVSWEQHRQLMRESAEYQRLMRERVLPTVLEAAAFVVRFQKPDEEELEMERELRQAAAVIKQGYSDAELEQSDRLYDQFRRR